MIMRIYRLDNIDMNQKIRPFKKHEHKKPLSFIIRNVEMKSIRSVHDSV